MLQLAKSKIALRPRRVSLHQSPHDSTDRGDEG